MVSPLVRQGERQAALNRCDKRWGAQYVRPCNTGRSSARSAAKLNHVGVRTAKQLRDANLDEMQKLLTIVGRRIVLELRGESCLALEMIQEDRKQIVCSKSFGRPVYTLADLQEAVANYVTRACEKLRRQDGICHTMSVFVQTNRFKDGPQYYNSGMIKMDAGTSSTVRLSAAANRVLEQILAAD